MASQHTHGRQGEEIARAYLVSRGYRLVTNNWRPAASGMRGELDIIGWEKDTLCFIEVKTRLSREGPAPQEAVTPSKQVQISRLANAYASIHRLHEVNMRFDVVEVWLPQGNQLPRVALHRNAFDYQERPARFR